MRKEKKRALAQKRAAGELDENEEEKLRAPKRPRMSKEKPFCQLVVDLGFDEKMSDNEVKSLASQLGYTYSANRRAPTPFKLLFTGLGGRTLERLESQNDASYKRWQGTEWWREGYEGVVYLTADSEVELSELKEDETYIIGGICDHNRYKNLCLNKAKETGIRTARLPIGRYLAHMPTRKVLTVNQVVEIMGKWVETRDWEKALLEVMPKRKFNPNGRQQKGGGKGGEKEDGVESAGGNKEGHDAGVVRIGEEGTGAAEDKCEKEVIVVSEDAAMAIEETA
ncbi:guanine-1-methyltransferase-domain-containing protein [Schizophyllum commune]